MIPPINHIHILSIHTHNRHHQIFPTRRSSDLFADSNELAYRIIFFFKAYCRHKILPQSDREPYTAHRSLRPVAQAQTGWRNGANHGEIPTRSLAFLFESFCVVTPIRCPPRASLISRTFGGPAPAAKYIDIDAFNGRTVTRETLLSYRVHRPSVNLIFRGNVWKNTGQALALFPSSFPQESIGSQAWHRDYRMQPLP